MDFSENGIAHMMRRALNTLDYRLVDHGERVAYIVANMMRGEGGHTRYELKQACYLGMFHDIGAYKTETVDSLLDINQMLSFEIKNSFSHSIYGYLFLRSVLFLGENAEAILFHHFTYPKLMQSDCKSKELAAKIFMADRIDIMITKGIGSTAAEIIKHLDNPVFRPEDVENIKKQEAEHGIISKIMTSQYLDELFEFLDTEALTEEHATSLIEMLPYVIDFRSESTVTHTVATVEATMTIAELLELAEEERRKLYYGALLHDMGKISTSLMILEKPDKLSDLEAAVMKDHVSLTEYILKGTVSQEIMNIAIRHHEKLDGTGYPHGIKGEELTRNERIVAVADILSALLGRRSYKEPFPGEKVIAILQKMADDNKICKEIVKLVLDNYDLISARIEVCNDNATAWYDSLKLEFRQIFDKYQQW